MKRVKWLFISIFFIFGLASCDLLSNEDVEELTEEYCTENPDSTICQGEFINDLQEAAVVQLFWDLYDDLVEQIDICDTYVSLSNLQLLEDCRQGFEFFPAGIEEYEFIEVVEDTDAEKNTVSIYLKLNDHSDQFIFNIVIVKQADKMMIEQWSYDTQSPSHEAMYTVMLEEWTVATDSTTFCEEWFVPENVQDCENMFDISKDEGFWFTLDEYVTGSPDNVKTMTVDDIPKQYEFTVEFVKTAHTYRIDQELIANPIDEFETFVTQFILGLNSISLLDEEVCGMHLEMGRGYEECVLKRQQIINDNETVTIEYFEWMDEVDLEFTVELEFDSSLFTVYTNTVSGFFYLNDDDELRIELLLPFELSKTERVARLNLFVANMNDDSTPIVDILNDVGHPEVEMKINEIRTIMIEQDIDIESHNISFGSTYFDFTLENGDHYFFKVEFTHNEGTWDMSMEQLFYLDELTWLDKWMTLESFVNAFNTGAATDEVICTYYITAYSSGDCDALRAELRDANQYLDIYQTDFDSDPGVLQLSVTDELLEDIYFYIYYDLEFTVVDNQVYLILANESRYIPLTYDDSLVIFNALVDDLFDVEETAEDICSEYGSIFEDCLTIMSDIRAEDLLPLWSYLTETDDPGLFDFSLRFYHMGILWRELEVEVTLYEDEDGETIIMGRSISDILVPPDEEYYSVFESFLEYYFNESNTDQDIYDEFYNGMEFEGLYKRDYILTQGITYVINDITWHADMGFVWYEADVTFTRSDDVVTDHIIKYELFPAMPDGVDFRLFFDIMMPEQSVIDTYADQFVEDLNMLDVDPEGFCEHFFTELDYDLCIDFTNQALAGDITSILNLVTREDYYASILVDFMKPDTSTTQLLFELHPIHDIKGTVYLTTELMHPDTTSRDALSNYISNSVIYGFNVHGINIEMFCLERAVCGTAFDDITSQVQHLQYVEVAWNLDDFFNPELHVKIEFNYYDGVIETHEYSATYDEVEDWWMLHFIQKVPLE